MNVAIAGDHGGFELKKTIIEWLSKQNINYCDFGCYTEDSVDYPDYSQKVGEAVISQRYDRGILICGSGVGISIAANKIAGIRCALVSTKEIGKLSRLHNDSNVLALGGRFLGVGEALEIVEIWLETEFEAGRHQKRIEKISCLESKYKGLV